MTELLEKAMPNGKPLCVYAQLKTLPAEEQDAIASRLLAEMEDEQNMESSVCIDDRRAVGSDG